MQCLSTECEFWGIQKCQWWRSRTERGKLCESPNPLFHDGVSHAEIDAAQLQSSGPYAALFSTELTSKPDMSNMRLDGERGGLDMNIVAGEDDEQNINYWTNYRLSQDQQHSSGYKEASSVLSYKGCSTKDPTTSVIRPAFPDRNMLMDQRLHFQGINQNMDQGIAVPADPTSVESWVRWMEKKQHYYGNYQPLFADDNNMPFSRIETQCQSPTGHHGLIPHAMSCEGREQTNGGGTEDNSCVLSLEAAEFLELDDGEN